MPEDSSGWGGLNLPWTMRFQGWIMRLLEQLTRWFQTFFIFTPTWGNDPIWLAHIFQMAWFNHLAVEISIFSISESHETLWIKSGVTRFIGLMNQVTPGSTNIAGWKMGVPDCSYVFPIGDGDIPASYVRLPEGTFEKKNDLPKWRAWMDGPPGMETWKLLW